MSTWASCGPLPTTTSTANTTWRNAIGGKTLKYGGSSGPNDYSTDNWRIHNNLIPDLDNWSWNIAYYARTFRGTDIDWFGHFGFFANNRPSWHQRYKAWDINHVRFKDGTYLDMVRQNESWDSTSRTERRLYWAIDASLRRYFHTTIDGLADPQGHHNHIHVDESCGGVTAPYTPWMAFSKDTKFIQRLCKDFNASGIGLDGVWGPNTDAAFDSLLSRLGMSCLNPDKYTSSWKTFLGYIMRHGLANKSAGRWKYNCPQ